ncbi:MAG: hypothetical protein JSW59_00400 [Phycisphaerales bacterium]|nr:MAG: hypothetical protein JSW59_00400 [Phycisphaerales bacterium]
MIWCTPQAAMMVNSIVYQLQAYLEDIGAISVGPQRLLVTKAMRRLVSRQDRLYPPIMFRIVVCGVHAIGLDYGMSNV